MKKYFDLAKVPIIISVAVTLLRFAVEKMDAPKLVSGIIGIAWLAPIFGIYFAVKLKNEPHRYGALFKTLLVYGISVRLVVVALMLAASFAHMGTHYDVGMSPGAAGVAGIKPVVGNLRHHLFLTFLPQLVFWAFIWTEGLGMLAGSITFLIKGRPAAAPTKA